jgi:hypothetical protein
MPPASKKPKTKRLAGALTPQQKFARNAGAAWRSMTDDDKALFGNNYMGFVAKLRQCPNYVALNSAQLKACFSR